MLLIIGSWCQTCWWGPGCYREKYHEADVSSVNLSNQKTNLFCCRSNDVISVMKTAALTKEVASTIMTQTTTPHSALSPITVATAAAQCLAVTLTTTSTTTKISSLPSPKKGKRHEDGWKEVIRRWIWLLPNAGFLMTSQNSNYETTDPPDVLLQWCIRAAEN